MQNGRGTVLQAGASRNLMVAVGEVEDRRRMDSKWWETPATYAKSYDSSPQPIAPSFSSCLQSYRFFGGQSFN